MFGRSFSFTNVQNLTQKNRTLVRGKGSPRATNAPLSPHTSPRSETNSPRAAATGAAAAASSSPRTSTLPLPLSITSPLSLSGLRKVEK